MASLRAHLFDLMVRFGVKRRLGEAPDLAVLRTVFGQPGFPPPRADYAPTRLGGLPCERVHLPGAGPGPRLLYLHGGGYIGCSPLTHRPITGAFACAGFDVYAPDYRLAPEHPFPAAIEDALAAWRDLSARGPAVVAGDSAGGNLALALMTEAGRLGLPMPRAAALFSPACDYSGRGASFRENARSDAMFSPALLLSLIDPYLAGADPLDPRVCALEADLRGLPPLLVHVGAREMLRDDSIRLAERARAAGVRVDLMVWPVVPHAWQLAQSFLPEARASLEQASAFLHQAAGTA